MGRLGWIPEVALSTDVNLILIAWEGLQDADEEFGRLVLMAGGIEVPPPRDMGDPDPAEQRARWLAWKDDKNEEFAERQRRAPKRRRSSQSPEKE